MVYLIKCWANGLRPTAQEEYFKKFIHVLSAPIYSCSTFSHSFTYILTYIIARIQQKLSFRIIIFRMKMCSNFQVVKLSNTSAKSTIINSEWRIQKKEKRMLNGCLITVSVNVTSFFWFFFKFTNQRDVWMGMDDLWENTGSMHHHSLFVRNEQQDDSHCESFCLWIL